MEQLFSSKSLNRLALIFGFITCLFHIIGPWQQWVPIASSVLESSRWMTLIVLFGLGLKKKSLTFWIFFSMLLGAEVGLQFPDIAKHLKVLSKIFLNLIKSIIAPLLFGTLVVGIAGHSDLKQVGRMGWKSIVYFEIVTTIALVIGLLAINLSGIGWGVNLSPDTIDQDLLTRASNPQTWDEILLHTFPENIAKSVSEGQILQIVVFSVLFGVGLAMVKDEHKKKTVLDFAEGLSEVMFKFTNIVMYLAPLAVGGAIAYTVSKMGIDVLANLFKLVALLYVTLAVFIIFVLLPIALLLKVPIKKFIEAVSEPVSIAFATASSEAALPKALEKMEAMGVPRKIVSFVLPTGYSFNLDGTTLYLSLAAVFIAQASGKDLTISQEIIMCLTLMLTSKGVAGIRGASFLILIATIESLGLDPQKAFALLAIDALMDMGRTSVNVIGNCLATVVVAKWEKEM
jgi:proton glutamate symport protein